MGIFSGGGSVFDDAVTAGTGGLLNPGAAKDAKRDAAKQNAALSAEAQALRKEGMAYGDAEFEKIYGTTKDQVGLDMRDLIQRRKDALGQTSADPIANRIRQSGNDAVRSTTSSLAQSGVKGGAGAKALTSIKRQADRDVNSQLAQKYMSDLNASQQMTGNLATQSQRLPQVYAQLFQGGQVIPPVGQAPFLGGMFDGGIAGGIIGGGGGII